MRGFSFEVERAEHPLYVTYEGLVRSPGETEPMRCFLLLAEDHVTLELKSLNRTVPEEIMTAWVAHLGSPVYGPITHSRTGEIEEPFGEMILTATWQFDPHERASFTARVEDLLEKRLDHQPHSRL